MLMLEQWLRAQVTGWQNIILFLLICLVIKFTYGISVALILKQRNTPLPDLGGMIVKQGWFWTVIRAPFEEEIRYRVLPVLMIVFFSSEFYLCLLLLILWSGILFGIAHGSMRNILVQGVYGLIYATVFLKCGAFGNNFLLGFMCCWLLHAIYNAIVYRIVAQN